MQGLLRWLPLVMALLAVPACGVRKQAAEKALAAAETAYAVVAKQATDMAPDRAREIETAIAAARASFVAGHLQDALAAAADLRSRIESLAGELPRLEAELREDWASLSGTIPGALAEVRRKLDDFGRPPAGMPERTQFDATSAELVKMGHEWEAAQSLAVSGKLAEAVALGGHVKQGAVRMLTDMQTGS